MTFQIVSKFNLSSFTSQKFECLQYLLYLIQRFEQMNISSVYGKCHIFNYRR